MPAFYFVSIFLGEIAIQLLTISAAPPLPVHTHPVRLHQNQRHLGPVAQQSSFGQEAELGQGFFPLNFKRSIHECYMHKQITGKRDLPQGNVVPGSSLCQSCVWRIVCLLQMGFRKIWKRYDQNLGQNSDLEVTLLIANRTCHYIKYKVCIFIKFGN